MRICFFYWLNTSENLNRGQRLKTQIALLGFNQNYSIACAYALIKVSLDFRFFSHFKSYVSPHLVL